MSLLDPAIEAAFQNGRTSNGFPDRQKTWFDFRLGMREDGWPGPAPGKENQLIKRVLVSGGEVGQSSVHRAHFLDDMVRLVPDGIAQFGKRVEEVERRGEKMVLTFQDGSTADADAVVGCDGVKSRTREILLGKSNPMTKPTFTGKYAYRGLITMEKAAAAIGNEYARNSQVSQHILRFQDEKKY
jgi:salicylate hydroxylase